MTPIRKVELKNIIKNHTGKALVYGDADCNLLVMEMFIPDMHKKLKGRYKTKAGGARLGEKEYGIKHLKQWLSLNMKEIDPNFIQPFDIVVFDGVDVAINMTSGYFGILENKTFGFIDKKSVKPKKVYRGE